MNNEMVTEKLNISLSKEQKKKLTDLAVMENKAEISGIFHLYGEEYKATHRLTVNQHKSFEAIKNCRTAEMGGHVNQCNHCEHKEQSYNSCRNRHCPKCGQTWQIKWADKLQAGLLPVKYFHIVFTILHELAPLVYQNQQVCYDIQFKASVQSLQQAALNPEYLGVEAGCVAVLHTWGQNLQYHSHIHMIVPAGGLDPDGMEWKHSGKNFFVPVKTLSKIKPLGKFFEWLFERTRRRGNRVIEKYEEIGLLALVAIPLPGTGAWTGALIAFLFGLDFKKSFLVISVGVFIAGVIVTCLCLLGWLGAIIAGSGFILLAILGFWKL